MSHFTHSTNYHKKAPFACLVWWNRIIYESTFIMICRLKKKWVSDSSKNYLLNFKTRKFSKNMLSDKFQYWLILALTTFTDMYFVKRANWIKLLNKFMCAWEVFLMKYCIGCLLIASNQWQYWINEKINNVCDGKAYGSFGSHFVGRYCCSL